MHFGISEGKGGGGVKTWKPSVLGYGYFLELPNDPRLLQSWCIKEPVNVLGRDSSESL